LRQQTCPAVVSVLVELELELALPLVLPVMLLVALLAALQAQVETMPVEELEEVAAKQVVENEAVRREASSRCAK